MSLMGTRAGGPDGASVVVNGDFTELLRLSAGRPSANELIRASSPPVQTEATTVLSFQYKDGVLNAGDRRATAGNIIM